MKKQIPIIQKHIINKKKTTNIPNSSMRLNTFNNNQANNSLLSSVTSPSISKKSKDINRILSPTENHPKNKKKKNIESMQQVSCSICFANKKEFSFFNCTCKNVVCKECYIKWRKQNNICPFCRRTIII